MRKSERIRLLEMELVIVNMQIQLMQGILDSILENSLPRVSDMDSGKWYTRKPNPND